MYKLVKDSITGNIGSVLRIADNAYIPLAGDMPDYQQYLKWVAEGNEPLPADEGVA